MSSNSSPKPMITSESLRLGSPSCRTTPRWAVLKDAEIIRTEDQENALQDLVKQGCATTSKVCRVKKLLRWARRAESKQAAKWRMPHFLKPATEYATDCPLLEPARGALASVERHLPRVLHRWHSLHTNARLEGFNSLFQAARARARGNRNVENFVTMVYLIAAPIQVVVASRFPQQTTTNLFILVDQIHHLYHQDSVESWRGCHTREF